ncbi:MAG: response regulator [Elusimicrobiales bacterium]|nr:response regulator [Elusimicrobiales bacterium]
MAKILIIDDDAVVRDALTVFLMRDGHTVVAASDGLNGLQLYKREAPDLVVLDRALPGLTGSGVFDEMRKVSRHTPIMILTGFDAQEEAEIYLRNGAAAFVSKGEGLSRVLEVISGLLGKPAAPEKERPAKILIAEDDLAMLDVLRRCFSQPGYQVFTAADGTQAVRLGLSEKPDIVLLDIFMPGKDGIEVLEVLSAALPGTGIMMISGNDDEAIAKDCLQKGAFDYLCKPPDLGVLENIVKTRLFMQKSGPR